MRSYNSHGQSIDVEFRPFGIFFWLLAGFVVHAGGRTFLPKFKGIGPTTETEFDFNSDGRHVSGVVRSLGPMWFLPRMHYAVIVGDSEIARDVQTLRYWYLSFLSAGVGFILILVGLIMAIRFVSAFYQAA